MRRLLSLVLALSMLLCGCAKPQPQPKETAAVPVTTVPVPTTIPWEETELQSSSLGSVKLLNYVEEEIRTELSQSLDPEIYRVDEVSVKYISKEYLEELEYNSQVNIFFGYTLAEVEAMFEGDSFVFTLGDDGQTNVERFVANGNMFDRLVRHVAQGGGVLLVRVTVIAEKFGSAAQMLLSIGSENGKINSAKVLGTIIKSVVNAIPEAIKAGSWQGALAKIACRVGKDLLIGSVCGFVDAKTTG
jgi:hypothetical protein